MALSSSDDLAAQSMKEYLQLLSNHMDASLKKMLESVDDIKKAGSVSVVGEAIESNAAVMTAEQGDADMSVIEGEVDLVEVTGLQSPCPVDSRTQFESVCQDVRPVLLDGVDGSCDTTEMLAGSWDNRSVSVGNRKVTFLSPAQKLAANKKRCSDSDLPQPGSTLADNRMSVAAADTAEFCLPSKSEVWPELVSDDSSARKSRHDSVRRAELYFNNLTSCVPGIRITEVHPSGRWIRLKNTSTIQDVDLGGHYLLQTVGKTLFASFQFPPSALLPAGQELIIWSGRVGPGPCRHSPQAHYFFPSQPNWASGPQCITVLTRPDDKAIAWVTAGCGRDRTPAEELLLNDDFYRADQSEGVTSNKERPGDRSGDWSPKTRDFSSKERCGCQEQKLRPVETERFEEQKSNRLCGDYQQKTPRRAVREEYSTSGRETASGEGYLNRELQQYREGVHYHDKSDSSPVKRQSLDRTAAISTEDRVDFLQEKASEDPIGEDLFIRAFQQDSLTFWGNRDIGKAKSADWAEQTRPDSENCRSTSEPSCKDCIKTKLDGPQNKDSSTTSVKRPDPEGSSTWIEQKEKYLWRKDRSSSRENRHTSKDRSPGHSEPCWDRHTPATRSPRYSDEYQQKEDGSKKHQSFDRSPSPENRGVSSERPVVHWPSCREQTSRSSRHIPQFERSDRKEQRGKGSEWEKSALSDSGDNPDILGRSSYPEELHRQRPTSTAHRSCCKQHTQSPDFKAADRKEPIGQEFEPEKRANGDSGDIADILRRSSYPENLQRQGSARDKCPERRQPQDQLGSSSPNSRRRDQSRSPSPSRDRDCEDSESGQPENCYCSDCDPSVDEALDNVYEKEMNRLIPGVSVNIQTDDCRQAPGAQPPSCAGNMKTECIQISSRCPRGPGDGASASALDYESANQSSVTARSVNKTSWSKSAVRTCEDHVTSATAADDDDDGVERTSRSRRQRDDCCGGRSRDNSRRRQENSSRRCCGDDNGGAKGRERKPSKSPCNKCPSSSKTRGRGMTIDDDCPRDPCSSQTGQSSWLSLGSWFGRRATSVGPGSSDELQLGRHNCNVVCLKDSYRQRSKCSSYKSSIQPSAVEERTSNSPRHCDREESCCPGCGPASRVVGHVVDLSSRGAQEIYCKEHGRRNASRRSDECCPDPCVRPGRRPCTASRSAGFVAGNDDRHCSQCTPQGCDGYTVAAASVVAAGLTVAAMYYARDRGLTS